MCDQTVPPPVPPPLLGKYCAFDGDISSGDIILTATFSDGMTNHRQSASSYYYSSNERKNELEVLDGSTLKKIGTMKNASSSKMLCFVPFNLQKFVCGTAFGKIHLYTWESGGIRQSKTFDCSNTMSVWNDRRPILHMCTVGNISHKKVIIHTVENNYITMVDPTTLEYGETIRNRTEITALESIDNSDTFIMSTKGMLRSYNINRLSKPRAVDSSNTEFGQCGVVPDIHFTFKDNLPYLPLKQDGGIDRKPLHLRYLSSHKSIMSVDRRYVRFHEVRSAKQVGRIELSEGMTQGRDFAYFEKSDRLLVLGEYGVSELFDLRKLGAGGGGSFVGAKREFQRVYVGSGRFENRSTLKSGEYKVFGRSGSDDVEDEEQYYVISEFDSMICLRKLSHRKKWSEAHKEIGIDEEGIVRKENRSFGDLLTMYVSRKDRISAEQMKQAKEDEEVRVEWVRKNVVMGLRKIRVREREEVKVFAFLMEL